MALIKGTIWNIATLVIGLKLALTRYDIYIFKSWSMEIVGGIMIAVSVWFLLSRLMFGPHA